MKNNISKGNEDPVSDNRRNHWNKLPFIPLIFRANEETYFIKKKKSAAWYWIAWQNNQLENAHTQKDKNCWSHTLQLCRPCLHIWQETRSSSLCLSVLIVITGGNPAHFVSNHWKLRVIIFPLSWETESKQNTAVAQTQGWQLWAHV